MKWKLGDKVRLNSGSPVMEVVGFSRNGNVWVEWELLDGGGVEEASFHPDMVSQAATLD